MTGLTPIAEWEASGDITTGANIDQPLSRSQRAVDRRIETQVRPLVAEAIGDVDIVEAAVAAQVTDEIAGRNLVEASRDNVPATADLNNLNLSSQVGSYGLLADGEYLNAPPFIGAANLEVLRGAGSSGATVSQRVTADNGTWWRKGINVTNGTWKPWEQAADAQDVSVPASSQAILELARTDGWKAVYDPTNPQTRVMRNGRVMGVADALGAMPDMISGNASSDPGLTRGGFGQLDGLEFGVGGVAQALRTGDFATPNEQPNFIMTMARSRTGASSTGRILLDGQTAFARNAIIVSASGPGSWGMFAGSEWRATGAPQDAETHILGAQFAGSGTRMFIDGVPQYFNGGGTFTYPMGGITLGNRYASSAGTFWDGWAGPVLVFDGIPSDDVRGRMTRLLRSLSTLGATVEDKLNSRAAFYRTSANSVLFQKNAQDLLLPASLTKTLTAWVARQTITNARLDETVTITVADDVSGVGAIPRLAVGDVISYRDLFYLMALPSNNAAARAIGRTVGAQLPGTGSGMSRFVAAMNSQIAAWGWEGATFSDTSGLSPLNRMSATQVAELMFRIVNDDATLLDFMGELTREITITGTNARTMIARHSIDPDGVVKFPEFVAGKTGTYGSSGSVAMLMREPDDSLRCVVTMQATPPAQRYVDARAVLDDNTGTLTSTSMVMADLANSRNLEDAGSWTRQRMDALYGADPVREPQSIISRLPGAETSPAGGVDLTRVGSMVSVTFADATLPAGFAVDAAIPKGFLPLAPFVYGTLNPDRATDRAIPVQIGSSGRLAVFGNTATERLRGSLTWLTAESFPAG